MNKTDEPRALWNIGRQHAAAGQHDLALTAWNTALYGVTERGEDELVVNLLTGIAEMQRLTDQSEAALQTYSSLLRRLEHAHDIRSQAMVWSNMGLVQVCAQSYEKAFQAIFNLAGVELISYRRLIEVLELIMGRVIVTERMSIEEIDTRRIPLPFPLDQHLVYSGTQITAALGFSYTPFVDGMASTYAWYCQSKKKEDRL
jgi:tetratricopeptide (TPR) repeat protein